MKIITAFLAAAAAALSLSSCDKELREDIPSSDNITVDITVGDFGGVDTKAVKSGWKSGDKLNIWFDGAYWNQLPQLVLTYDGSKWNESAIDASILNASGKFIVIYEELNNQFDTPQNSTTYAFKGGYNMIDPDTGNSFRGRIVPLSCCKDKVAYTYANGVLKASISGWVFLTTLQVVVTGLPKTASSYALKIEGLTNPAGYYFNGTTMNCSYISLNSLYSFGTDNADGVAFTFRGTGLSTSQDIVFRLLDLDTRDRLVYTKSNSTLATSSNSVRAIKIDSRKFRGSVNGHEYVWIGNRKWATMNLGATTEAGSPATCFGDYYAWGETEPRYTGMTIYGKNSVSISGWKTEYSEGYYKDSAYNGKSLDDAHDAAKVAWGSWHTPSDLDFQDLYAACGGEGMISSYWTPKNVAAKADTVDKGIYWCSDYDGIEGVVFSDGVNRLFFPAAGSFYQKNYRNGTASCSYWASTTYSGFNDNPYDLDVVSYSARLDHMSRNYGFSIRPVAD